MREDIKISYSPISNLRAGSSIQRIPFIDVLKIQEKLKRGNKSSNGSIYAYSSYEVNPQELISGNVIFVDIDDLKREDADLIYNSFEDLTSSSKIPNLLAMSFSYSHNIHAFFYTSIQLDETSYKEYACNCLAHLAYILKRDYKIELKGKQLDTHNTNISQKFFLAPSPYKWNDLATMVDYKNMSSKLEKLFPTIYEKRSSSWSPSSKIAIFKTNSIVPEGEKVTVNQDFNICGVSGFDARTIIAATLLVHFNNDETKTIQYICDHYTNSDEILSQLKSMYNQPYVNVYYRKEAEEELFPTTKRLLKDGEYLPQVLNKLPNDKYIYIVSNTNTGKTEYYKNFIRSNNNSIIALQMNKALRDGKKQGIEEYTKENNEDIDFDNNVNVTIDAFLNHYSSNISLEDKILFVDEAHLLQDYVSIDGKSEAIKGLLQLIPSFKQVIFLSATPKNEINLFPFRVLTFEKKQNQTINIIRKKIQRCSLADKYTYMNNFVQILNTTSKPSDIKTVIFSNKKRSEWMQYGLNDYACIEDICFFSSDNYRDPSCQAILNDNKLLNYITFSTNYMGVGVEVKGEEEVNVIFCLDEGWDEDFIIQSIGRFRDAKTINVYFFYCNDKVGNVISQETINELDILFRDHYIVTKENGEGVINLVASRKLNYFDPNWNTVSEKEGFIKLKIANISNNNSNVSPSEICRTIKMMNIYKNVNVLDEEEVENVFKTNIHHKVRREHELFEKMRSMDEEDIVKKIIDAETYDEILEELPWFNKSSARKELKAFRYIYKNGIKDPNIILDYFDSFRICQKEIHQLIESCSVKLEENVVVADPTSEVEMKMVEKIEKDHNIANNIFTQEYIDFIYEKVRRRVYNESEDILFIESDDEMNRLLGIPDILTPSTSFDGEFFIGEDFKSRKKKIAQSKAGKYSGKKSKQNNIQPITIKEIRSGKKFKFPSKEECMKFLETSTRTFSQFIKGKSKLNKKYIIVL